jgi:micrococcal nuclease
VLIVYAQNWSQQSATMSMDHFKLVTLSPKQATASVDSSSPAVAQFLGISPGYRANDSVLFAPGEGHRLVLTFLVDPKAKSLQLRVGETAIDLKHVNSDASTIDSATAAPSATDLLQGKVIEVIDGETIRVEINGEQGLVRYSGIAAPTGDACYATQATTANRKLVEGKTVWLERQRFNTSGKDALTRDVWVESGDGGRQLVAEALVAQGAAIPQIREPDTRFAGWLTAAAAAAKAKGAGVWGACGGRGHG